MTACNFKNDSAVFRFKLKVTENINHKLLKNTKVKYQFLQRCIHEVASKTQQLSKGQNLVTKKCGGVKKGSIGEYQTKGISQMVNNAKHRKQIKKISNGSKMENRTKFNS